jgi:hypothetical protein
MDGLWMRFRTLPDGRTGWVFPLTFGRARLGVSEADNHFEFEDEW